MALSSRGLRAAHALGSIFFLDLTREESKRFRGGVVGREGDAIEGGLFFFVIAAALHAC